MQEGFYKRCFELYYKDGKQKEKPVDKNEDKIIENFIEDQRNLPD